MAKRIFDLVFAALGLILLSPVFLAIALMIRRDSAGQALFTQERVGKNRKPFRLIKFRTMREKGVSHWAGVTTGKDPRITRIGKILRRYRIDELPQLINVVKGEMSLVGPRPELAKYVDCYPEQYKQVLSILPGITDPTTIRYRNESLNLPEDEAEKIYIKDILPKKINLYLKYVENNNIFTDTWIILNTLKAVTMGNKQHKGG